MTTLTGYDRAQALTLAADRDLLDSLTLCTTCAHAAGDHRDGDGMCTNPLCDCNRMETKR